jgi:hypothetical protein
MHPADVRVHDFLGKEGEKMLPGYKYGSSWQLLYDSYGDTTDHFYGRHGAFSVVVELTGMMQDFDGNKQVSQDEQMKFNDELTQGRMFVAWKTVQHPTYGEIEVGGFRHDTNRAPEGFLANEEFHRNAMYALLHAFHLPKLQFGTPEVVKVKEGLYRIHQPILNGRMLPTLAAIVAQNKLLRPDVASITGGKVIASGIVTDRFMNRVQLQEKRPEQLMVQGGIGGMETKTLMFLVEAKPGALTLSYDGVKTGKLTTTITLP